MVTFVTFLKSAQAVTLQAKGTNNHYQTEQEEMMMTNVREVCHCLICGHIVEVLREGAVLSCCGKPMQLLSANVTDGAYEKHVPIVERTSRGFRVSVGSVEHPMTEGHYIQWIELLTPMCVMRRELHPGDKPEAVFLTDEVTACGKETMACGIDQVSAREYCNLHGLWSNK